MIQLNLLPDIKQEYAKAQRSQRLAASVAFLIGAASIGLLIVLLAFLGLQRKHLHDLSNDIKKQSIILQKQAQIGKVLTVQNQLDVLSDLHSSKPAATKVFTYLNQVTPVQVDISSFTVDFVENKISITGSADALSNVNQYVDTLKFTKYSSVGSNIKTPAFDNIVLTNFALTTGDKPTGRPATYTIDLTYDTEIFDVTKDINLIVPSQVTTRSELDQATDLFRKSLTSENTKSTGN